MASVTPVFEWPAATLYSFSGDGKSYECSVCSFLGKSVNGSLKLYRRVTRLVDGKEQILKASREYKKRLYCDAQCTQPSSIAIRRWRRPLVQSVSAESLS